MPIFLMNVDKVEIIRDVCVRNYITCNAINTDEIHKTNYSRL